MKKIILLFILTVAILGFESKSKHHKTHKTVEISKKDPIYKTAAQIELIKQSNKEADAKFATSKDGTDPIDEESYLGYDLYLGKKFTNGDDKTLNFQRYLFRVNKYALYYGDVNSGYRGIMGSIQLEDVIDSQDDVPSGNCCTKINDVEMRENIPLGAVQMDLFCFRIVLPDFEWVLCHEDKAKATEARNMIVLGVIKHYFWSKGMLGNLSVLSQGGLENLGWSWDGQDEWMGQCKDGKSQSPIIINTQETVQKENMRIIPKWQSLSVPIAKFDGHEMVIIGDFGQTVFQLQDKTKIYNVKEIRFKFPAEHRFGDRQSGAEMQIYHKSNSGGEAIASIFIQEGSDGSTDHNQFIENLEVEGWKLSSGKPYRLDARPDLSQIVKGGVTAYFQKTFYYYKGSLTTPPCSQGVDRFVFKDTLLIPSTQFNNLKNKVFNIDDESAGNSRRARKSDGMTIFYHIDKSINCKMASNKVLEAAEEQVARIESTKSKSYQGKFIKARTSLNTYGAFFGDGFGTISDDKRGVEVVEIPEMEVPADVREKIGKEEYDRVTKYSKEVLTDKGFDASKVKIITKKSEDYMR